MRLYPLTKFKDLVMILFSSSSDSFRLNDKNFLLIALVGRDNF